MINGVRDMNKKLVIDSCGDCPFFDDEYYSYASTCRKLDRHIKRSASKDEIPVDCPLESTSDEADELRR